MRAVPRENESTNETWLSDRDRYSHFGLNAEDRVLEPMIKFDGEWQVVSWEEGIRAATEALRSAVSTHGGEQLGALMSAGVSTEEYYLAQRLVRGLDCQNIDYRLREQDFSDDQSRSHGAAFSTPMAAIDVADIILLVGSHIQHEAPLLGQRVRKAWRRGAKISALNPVNWNLNFSLDNSLITAPQNMVSELAAIAKAVSGLTGKELPGALQAATNNAEVGEVHRAIAKALIGEGNKMIMLGQAALAHREAAWLRSLSSWVSSVTGSALNIVSHGGNATGAEMAGALPGRGPGGSETDVGLDARGMVAATLKSYLLWDIEPRFDIANPSLALEALGSADHVVAVVAFAGEGLRSFADVILPLAPGAESEGRFYTLDGQSFDVQAAVKASGQAKPGWKILRQMGAALELEGFNQVDRAGLLNEMQAEIGQPNNSTDDVDMDALDLAAPQHGAGLYRVGELAMYSVDALCRRSEELQHTVHAQNDFVGLNVQDARELALSDGQHANVSQGGAHTSLPVRICNELPVGAVWVKSAIGVAVGLGDSFGPISVETV